MKSLLRFISEKLTFLNMDDVLTQKGMEVAIYAALDFVLWIGLLAVMIFNDSQLIKNLASMSLVVFCVLGFIAGRYFYYVMTERYQVISGTIIGVQSDTGISKKSQNCSIFLVGVNGNRYVFHTKYNQTLHGKDKKLTVYAVQVNEFYKKDGFIHLDNILCQTQFEV